MLHSLLELLALFLEVLGRAPQPLHGLIEVRGVGVETEPALAFAEVVMVVRPGAPERVPQRSDAEILGVSLPVTTLPYLESSAPAKLRRALGALYVKSKRRM